MAIQTAEELFVTMLSHLHAVEQRQAQFADELSQYAQNKEVKNALEVRAFVGRQDTNTIEEIFKLLGEQPKTISTRVPEVMLEDMRRELNEIQSPVLKSIYVISAIRRLQDLHMGEYKILTVMAHLAENYPVAGLLERNLADKMAFAERTDEIIRDLGKAAFAHWAATARAAA